MSLARRAFLRGACAAALAPALPVAGARTAAPPSGAVTLRLGVDASGAQAVLAYQRALLRQICAALAIDYATLTKMSAEATAALYRQRLAAAHPRSPIASAGARQGLPTAILCTGAAS